MTEQEVQEIYNRLLELTNADTIQWKQTGDAEFTTSFSRASVTVERKPKVLGGTTILKIYNDAGLMVAYVSPKEANALDAISLGAKEFIFDPSELFNLVRDKVHSNTTEDILDELRKLKVS
jgi:hypothetical protein